MPKIRQTPADEPYYLIRTVGATVPRSTSLALHSHPWGQVLYAAAGVLDLRTRDDCWVAPANWAIWIPPEVPHTVRLAGGTSYGALYLRPDRCDRLPPHGATLEMSPLLRELFARAIGIGPLDARIPSHVAIADLIGPDLETGPAAPLRLPLPAGAPFGAIAERLAASPAARLDLPGLARRFGMSPRTIERGFTAATGLSIGRWHRQSRLLFALRELAAGRPIKQVARATGYTSPSAFIAAFRTALGTTPARYFARAGAGSHASTWQSHARIRSIDATRRPASGR
ncbi:MAG: helix-turn-helix transcriptional regulator [Gemmatimonadales bacterium]